MERLAQTRSEHGRQRGVPNAPIREDPGGKVVAVKRLRERRSEGVHVFGPQRTNVHRHDVSMAVYLCMRPRRMRYQHAHGTRTVRHRVRKSNLGSFIKSRPVQRSHLAAMSNYARCMAQKWRVNVTTGAPDEAKAQDIVRRLPDESRPDHIR